MKKYRTTNGERSGRTEWFQIEAYETILNFVDTFRELLNCGTWEPLPGRTIENLRVPKQKRVAVVETPRIESGMFWRRIRERLAEMNSEEKTGGYTITWLAESCGHGNSAFFLSIKRDSIPKDETVEKIAIALKVNVEHLKRI